MVAAGEVRASVCAEAPPWRSPAVLMARQPCDQTRGSQLSHQRPDAGPPPRGRTTVAGAQVAMTAVSVEVTAPVVRGLQRPGAGPPPRGQTPARAGQAEVPAVTGVSVEVTTAPVVRGPQRPGAGPPPRGQTTVAGAQVAMTGVSVEVATAPVVQRPDAVPPPRGQTTVAGAQVAVTGVSAEVATASVVQRPDAVRRPRGQTPARARQAATPAVTGVSVEVATAPVVRRPDAVRPPRGQTTAPGAQTEPLVVLLENRQRGPPQLGGWTLVSLATAHGGWAEWAGQTQTGPRRGPSEMSCEAASEHGSRPVFRHAKELETAPSSMGLGVLHGGTLASGGRAPKTEGRRAADEMDLGCAFGSRRNGDHGPGPGFGPDPGPDSGFGLGVGPQLRPGPYPGPGPGPYPGPCPCPGYGPRLGSVSAERRCPGYLWCPKRDGRHRPGETETPHRQKPRLPHFQTRRRPAAGKCRR